LALGVEYLALGVEYLALGVEYLALGVWRWRRGRMSCLAGWGRTVLSAGVCHLGHLMSTGQYSLR
jgi:hypothetical protein